MRLLQVITDNDRRGGQVFASDLHAAIEAQGWDVETVALGPGQYGGLGWDALGPTRRHPTTLRRLRQRARTADVVVAHGSTTLPACAIALAGSDVPFVYRQISDSLFWAPTRARRIRARLGLRRADGVVALWQGASEVLTSHFGVPASKLEVIPNGVPPQRFPLADSAERPGARQRFDLAPDVATALYVGALAPEKGVDSLVEAARHSPGLQLLIAGDGPARQDLERQVAREGAAERVRFAGFLSDAKSAYAAADVVVLPSRGGDSMPAVLIEAGLTGLPAIATPVQGIPDIVQDGVTGRLVPIGDAEALATALNAVLVDKEAARGMGLAARQHCLERFSIDVIARKWMRVCEAVRASG